MSNRITITIPSVNVPEVKYVFNCLMFEFLGLDYDIIVSNEVCDFSISCNSRQLEISNVFFREDDVTNLYSKMNIPTQVHLSDIAIGDINFPQVTLFGNPTLTESEKEYRWENDIVAATFFMLTRWEESVVLERDEHNRFMAKDSLAYKNDFLQRAIVNEYVEILYQILVSFGINQVRRQRRYNTVPTHDVDQPYLWASTIGKVKSMAASLLLRRNKEEIKRRSQSAAKGVDPFDTFDRLLDMADAINVKAHFFFMSGGDSEFDNYYQLGESTLVTLIDKIKERKHFIGIHPSYNSYCNLEMISSEIETLKTVADVEVTSSRQHFLRFDVNSTWSNLDKVNITCDSTMCYADAAGFRSGVCYEYPVFDLKQRKQLALIEKPLIVMDTTLQKYEKLAPLLALERVATLQKEVKRYEGDFVFLWHNSSFNSQEWIRYECVYESMYKQYNSNIKSWA